MDRRTFHRALLGALASAAATPTQARSTPTTQLPRVDGRRLNGWLETLSEFGRNELGGVTRPAYSDDDLAARTFVIEQMRRAGLATEIDAAGNIIGRRPGSDAALPPLGTGSHIDSVPEGGRYDGCVGSIAAIEVARTLNDARVRLRHPLEVIIFQNEENGKVGSKALRGEDPSNYLDFVTNSGYTVREGIRRIGGDPERVTGVKRAPGSLAAFVELHIEQGGTLEAESAQIGVVQGIVGIRRWNVVVEGFANHAGTTPMDRRRDALLAAARLVDAVNAAVRARPGRQVGTVGMLRAQPGAANVIAGRAELTIELRDLSMSVIDEIFADIEQRARRIGESSGTTFAFEPVYRTEPASCDPSLQGVIEAEAKAQGLVTLSLPSGAGHDAQEMAGIAPIGMIFVPSRGGISHSAEEYTAPEQIEAGANVLLHTLVRLDRTLHR